jgi:hypothetical protein
MSTLTTESGLLLVQEDVQGVSGASTLNDTKVDDINKEHFTTDPLDNGWLVGSGWAWNSTNDNMEAV